MGSGSSRKKPRTENDSPETATGHGHYQYVRSEGLNLYSRYYSNFNKVQQIIYSHITYHSTCLVNDVKDSALLSRLYGFGSAQPVRSTAVTEHGVSAK